MRHFNSGHVLEQLTTHVWLGTGARRSEGDLAAISLRMCDEFLDRHYRRGIRHHHHIRKFAYFGDGHEVDDRVIAGSRIEERVLCHEPASEKDCIAVRGRRGRHLRSEIAASAALVLDHDLLTPNF
jgi:hypothetical protein